MMYNNNKKNRWFRMPYPPNGQRRWFEMGLSRSSRDVRHAFLRVKQPCRSIFKRLLRKPMAQIALYGMMPSYGNMRRWTRTMKRVFEIVLIADEKGGICEGGDLEIVRDMIRFAIHCCPHPNLRVMENVLPM